MKFRIDNLLKRAKNLIDGYHRKNFACTVFKSSYLGLSHQFRRQARLVVFKFRQIIVIDTWNSNYSSKKIERGKGLHSPFPKIKKRRSFSHLGIFFSESRC